MRAPMRATAAAALLIALAACSPNLEGAKCGDDTNCPSGQRCGFDGTCRVGAMRYGVTLDPPAQGTVVGPAGKVLTAKVARASTNIPEAPTLILLASGASAATCTEKSQSGAVSFYDCTYTPAGGIDGPVRLVLLAAGGTSDASQGGDMDVLVDTAGPVIVSTLTCATSPCLRDGTLTVSAMVTDSHPGGGAVTASIAPADGGTAIATGPLTGSGGSYSGTFDLKSGPAPFPFYAQDLVATVTAPDALGNSGSGKSSALNVTRLRWSVPVESSSPPALTAPAVDDSGNAYVGADNGNVYRISAATGTVTASWPVASGITAAPSIGTGALWVGGQDRKVYAVDKSSGAILNSGANSCTTLGSVHVTPAVLDNGSDPETAFVGSNDASYAALYEVRTGGCTSQGLAAGLVFGGAPSIDTDRNVYAVLGTGLHSFQFKLVSSTWSWIDNWSGATVTVGAVAAPLAIDAAPSVWTVASSGAMNQTTNLASSPPTLNNRGSIGANPGSAIIDAEGNVVVGDQPGVLHRISPTGTALWANPPNLGAAVISAMAMAGGDVDYVIPTISGTLAGVKKSDGTVVWQGQVAGASLNEPNIVKLPGDTFSTAVFGAADGKVYAVIVDGYLDLNAPWPKAHHDPRNTGNAATQLP